ncbi:hypothetical protein AAFP30_18460 [Gordonia sp. CPCC 205515]|uniref:hypothetical protein n=1 Tax=Gordonia sp. CPCC 205515 TaxID=3140791 RepID=UPI003AF39AA0
MADRSDFLSWDAMDGVYLEPLDPTQARLLGIPPVDSRHIVGDGYSWLHHQPFPLRRIGRPSRDPSCQTTVFIDPTTVVDTGRYSDLGRCMWKYRPDIAAALGFAPPLQPLFILPTDPVDVTYYGTVDAGTSAGQTTVGDTALDLAFVVRDRVSRIPHQLVLTDGFGDVLRLVADDYTRTRTRRMTFYRSTRRRPLQLSFHRHDDGRIDVLTPKKWGTERTPTPDEFALGLALAAAVGTRSENLYNVPSSAVTGFLNGFRAGGG